MEKEVQKKRSEDEELEVYGTGTKTSVQLRKYTFEVCDSILNIGPIGYMCTGERMELDHDENTPKEVENISNMHLEIVTASGHNKNGALCVLQNSIRPQVLTSFELAGISIVIAISIDNQSIRKLNTHKEMKCGWLTRSQGVVVFTLCQSVFKYGNQ